MPLEDMMAFSNLNSVEVYEPDTDSWNFAASMCAHEGGVGIGVIPVDPRLSRR